MLILSDLKQQSFIYLTNLQLSNLGCAQLVGFSVSVLVSLIHLVSVSYWLGLDGLRWPQLT